MPKNLGMLLSFLRLFLRQSLRSNLFIFLKRMFLKSTGSIVLKKKQYCFLRRFSWILPLVIIVHVNEANITQKQNCCCIYYQHSCDSAVGKATDNNLADIFTTFNVW